MSIHDDGRAGVGRKTDCVSASCAKADCANMPSMRDAPIGIFDSGHGGLTVLREIVLRMPHESTVFVGDTRHFPYGPRDLDEVRGYVANICAWLIERGCKLVVIACNTATAAGLRHAQRMFDVPIVGVVEAGSRAAVYGTRNRRVGVIATEGTVDSGVYPRAIHNLDAGINVLSIATPQLVDIAEAGLQFKVCPEQVVGAASDKKSLIVSDRGVLDADSGATYQRIAKDYLAPLRSAGIDTLVLGCTHFPLIQPLIQEAAGEQVQLVSSAEETAKEVRDILARRNELSGVVGSVGADLSSAVDSIGNADSASAAANLGNNADKRQALREYYITGDGTDEFRQFGELVMGEAIESVSHLDL